MLKDYFKLQKEYETKYKEKTILLMQVGGFYESYCSDTQGFSLKELSGILNIQFTKKNKNLPVSDKNPYMLGFPLHSLKKYLKILLEYQFTVAVYHQEENSKGTITRHKTGVYTYATFIDDSEDSSTEETSSIISLFIDVIDNNKFHISASQIDLFTGKGNILINKSIDEYEQYAILQRFLQLFKYRELLICSNETFQYENLIDNLDIDNSKTMIQNFKLLNQHNINYQNEILERVYGKEPIISQIERIGLEKYPNAVISWVTLIDYTYEHNPKILKNIDLPVLITNENYLLLENNAIEQLNLISNNSLELSQVGKKYQSVYHVINNCTTSMGKRYLKQQLLQPLTNPQTIKERYSASEALFDTDIQINEILQGIVDIETLNRRLSIDLICPFQFKNLYLSYNKLSTLRNFEWNTTFLSDIPKFTFLKSIEECFEFDTFDEEKYFKKNMYPELDKLQDLIAGEKQNIDSFHKYLNKILNDKERKEINGIKLELGSSGYFFSVSSKRAKVLKGILDENDLKKISFKEMPKSSVTKIYLLNSIDQETVNKYREMNKLCWLDCCSKIYEKYKIDFYNVITWVSKIDFILSNIKTAKIFKYCKPQIIESDKPFVTFKGMRHPIIERLIKDKQPYVSHDINLGKKEDGILLYGLNSCGKSSLMKAIGINTILAQCGLYVPCQSMQYYPYKKLFTRITGNDNIFKGLSSFSLEMVEINNIIKFADYNSLIIGDEICKGTETISACAIVSSILIMIASRKCSFIFASHLHDLVKIPDILDLKNMNIYHLQISIDEKNKKIIYDRKLIPGSGENIYGVTVAKFVIKNQEFNRLTEKMIEIHKQLWKETDKIKITLLEDKKSKYNNKKFVDKCENCGKNANYEGEIETHHNLIHQKDCDEAGYFEHLHKNSGWNLKSLCKQCHKKEHHESK